MVSTLKVILIVVAAVVLVGVVGFAFLFSAIMSTPPPVDLYARPTPASSIEPESLLPSSVVGQALLETVPEEDRELTAATGNYEGSITIIILKWNSVGQAFNFMDNTFGTGASISTTSGESTTRIKNNDADWASRTISGESTLVWRKGIWVFRVSAPTEAVRDAVLQELRF